MNSQSLSRKKIAFLATDGVEQVELVHPWEKLKAAGAEVVLVSLKSGTIQGVNHDEKADTFSVDATVDSVSAEQFDGLVLPGGVMNPDSLRMNGDAVSFVRDFFKQEKPVAAICHGPWMLVEAGVVEGLKLTSWPSLQTDIKNAGGQWVDQECVQDQGLVTSRKPDDLDVFCQQSIELFASPVQSQR